MGGIEKFRLLFIVKRRKLLSSFLGQEDSMNVWQDAASRDRDASEQLVQLFIILDSKPESLTRKKKQIH